MYLGNAGAIGLYVHFPWCVSKCPYCDFLSVAVPEPSAGVPPDPKSARAWIDHEGYANAVIHELYSRVRALPRPLPQLVSVYFGGGTPSLWNPRAISRVLSEARLVLPSETDLEVTVECNPTSVDEAVFWELLEAGVNRVSVGVQALSNERLAFLGRIHDEHEALTALHQAREAGVDRVSADLVFGLYQQPPEDAAADVDRVLATGVTHLSSYALTIEEGTRFGAMARDGRLPLLGEALVAESFLAVSEEADKHGLHHYEVSNFALPGRESRHNIGYWTGRDYLGLGTGAFGTVTLGHDDSGAPQRVRYKNLLSPKQYVEAWQEERDTPFETLLAERECISPEIGVSEAILLGLRLDQGLSPSEVERRFGAPFWNHERRAAAERLFASGRLVEEAGRLFIPWEHWLQADGVIRELL